MRRVPTARHVVGQQAQTEDDEPRLGSQCDSTETEHLNVLKVESQERGTFTGPELHSGREEDLMFGYSTANLDRWPSHNDAVVESSSVEFFRASLI